jgi:hypothetical protein
MGWKILENEELMERPVRLSIEENLQFLKALVGEENRAKRFRSEMSTKMSKLVGLAVLRVYIPKADGGLRLISTSSRMPNA